MTEREGGEAAPYWQLDERVGDVRLFQETWSVRVRAHLADQPYGRSAAVGLVPLSTAHGVCTAVDARAYISVPDITVNADFGPSERPTDPIGHVVTSRWEGMKAEEVGAATAFAYHEDRVLCLWEVFLHDAYQTGEASEDQNYAVLWRGIENLLVQRFPDAAQLVTPADEPLYDRTDYQRFLEQLGYRRLPSGAFGKRVRQPGVSHRIRGPLVRRQRTTCRR